MGLKPLSIGPAGQVGFVVDIEPQELSNFAWTRAHNVRCKSKAIERLAGETPIYSTPLASGNFLYPVRSAVGDIYWIYGTETALYAVVGAVHITITRAVGGAYNGLNVFPWKGGVLGGIPVLTNGVDLPQAWLAPNTSTKMENLPNWPANYSCMNVRPFKGHLVALNITKDGLNYPTLVKWSHPADPGAVPASWDHTDPTKDAGEWPLSETPGACVDQLPLKDVNLIYKEDSVWGMQWVGGIYIFRFFKVFDGIGIPQPGFVCNIDQNRHCLWTGDDLLVHDGVTYRSVADDRVRDYLKAIPEDVYPNSSLVPYQAEGEVWLCWRSAVGVSGIDRILIWNWKEETFTERTCSPALSCITPGPIGAEALGADLWDSDELTWADDDTPWDRAASNPKHFRLCGLGADYFCQLDLNTAGNGEVLLERQYFGIPFRTDQPPDISSSKTINRLWPRFTSDAANVRVEITLGFSDGIAEEIKWKTPKIFTIGVTRKVDQVITGRLFSIRIRSLDPGIWRFHGMDVEAIQNGE